MINATFVYQKTGGVNDYANLAFTMFAIYLLLSIYIFARRKFVQIHFL